MTSLAQRLLTSGNLPRLRVRDRAPIRIGALVPMSGPEEPWGRPGLDGCRIWADWINDHGGMLLGGKRYHVELVIADSAQGERPR